MSDEAAFLRMICDNPDDDTPRLVFADWLQEQGDDDRAEFIRVQCRIAQLEKAGGTTDSDEHDDLLYRQRLLLDRHEKEWRRALPLANSPGWHWSDFERGFVSGVSVNNWSSFRPLAEQVFTAQPVHKMRIWGLTPALMGDFTSCAELSRLTELELARNFSGHEFAPMLVRVPSLAGLHRFSARANGNGNIWVNELLDTQAFPHLQSLDLVATGLNGDSAASLFHDNHWTSLTHLDLRDNAVEGEFLTQADDYPLLSRLLSLDLTGNSIHGSQLREIDRVTRESSIRSLRLSNNDFRFDAVTHLARSPLFANVTQLDLSNCLIGGDRLPSLVDAGFWSNLTSLDLSINSLGDEGLRHLTNATSPPQLRQLNLSHTGISSTLPLVRWPGLAQLEELRLAGIRMGDAGLTPLVRSSKAAQLRLLKVQNNQLTSELIRQLTTGPVLANLRSLDLSQNKIDSDGLRLLAESPASANLRRLFLDHNPIRTSAVNALLRSPHFPHLHTLTLDKQRISDTVITKLRERFGSGVRIT